MATKSKGKKRRVTAAGARVRAARHRVAKHLAPQIADVIGIGLVVLALLSVLAFWLDAAGPVGRFLRTLVFGLIGPAGYAFPVLSFYWGVLLIRGTAEEDRGRMFVGLWITAAGTRGFVALLAGNPSPGAGYAGFGRPGAWSAR